MYTLMTTYYWFYQFYQFTIFINTYVVKIVIQLEVYSLLDLPVKKGTKLKYEYQILTKYIFYLFNQLNLALAYGFVGLLKTYR